MYALEGTVYRGGIVSQLVDVPVHTYAAFGDLADPEETAAFYDDLDHALAVELHLQRVALAELCNSHQRLL